MHCFAYFQKWNCSVKGYMCICNFSEYCQIVLHRSCTILHAYLQCMTVCRHIKKKKKASLLSTYYVPGSKLRLVLM